jgi:NAD(P)-dependent dehydrogenase (short-subunit alcohol dehydrogenase family)
VETLLFEGRVALVTGAGRGMGRTHALLLAARGAKVIVNDVGGSMGGDGSSAQPAEQVAQEIRQAGGSAAADFNDVSTEIGANAMVRAAIDNFGRIDIVVHNAGIVTFIPFSEMTYDQYRKLVAVHQDGGFLVAKAAWPYMVKQGIGRFVFITSLANMQSLTHYASAKGAVTGFVRSLGAEGVFHNIRANALSVIAYTRMMAGYFDPTSNHLDVGLRGQYAIEKWWQEHLRPEQVSQVVGWLAHERCDVSGQTLFSGGGQVSLQFIGMTDGYVSSELTPESIHANRRQIFDTESGHYVYSANALDGWLFAKIVQGGAPEVPPHSDAGSAHNP